MTTQNFPPPTGTPQRTASGSTTGQTVDATSARDVGRRFLIPSATGLRLSRTLAALACLIAGAVGAWVLTTTSASLESINRGTQQMLRLQQIKGDVLRADGLATNGLAQGTAATAMTDYTDALKEASRLTVEASLAMPTDQNDLMAVNAGLLNYALTMERARTAYPKDNTAGLGYTADAGTALVGDTVPALDKLISDNGKRVDAARASDRLWAAGLALVPVVLLLLISLWLARRTKRAVNLGVLIALAASVVLWRLVDVNLVQSAAVVDSARAGTLQSATAAATAYSKLAEAKSIEGRSLLQPTDIVANETTWLTAMNEVNASVKKIGDAQASTAGLVSAYSSAHASLANLLKENKVTAAKQAAASTTSGVNPSYEAASDALSKTFSEAKTATATGMTQQQDGLRIASGIAVLLGVLGAAASWIGISQRIREYR